MLLLAPLKSHGIRAFKIAMGWRSRLNTGVLGLALGVLCNALLADLGAWDVVGVGDLPDTLAILAILGIAAGLGRRAEWLLMAVGPLLALYLVVAFTPVIARPMSTWVRNDVRPAVGADAIVVLSSGLNSDGNLGVVGADRLLAGLGLMKTGLAPRIITTRVTDARYGRYMTSDTDQRRLIQLAGVASSWMVLDSVGTTRQEAERAAASLLPRSHRTIAVVTSPSHTRRACAAFEKVGFVVYCVSARERGDATWRPKSQSDRLAAFQALVYERIGMWKYRIKGWV